MNKTNMNETEIIDLLKEQEIFKDISKKDNNEIFWNNLCKCSKTREYEKDSLIIKKDDDTTDMFLILKGSVDILKNGKKFANRKAKNSVGEIACLFKDIKRTADCKVAERSILAKISSIDFKEKILKNNEIIYKRIANTLAYRLKERVDAIRVNTRKKPVVFIASSIEGKKFAREVIKKLQKNNKNFTLQPWFSPKSFIASETTIDNLEKIFNNVDFSIIIFTPDDIVKIKKQKYVIPRDNLIFELGLSYSKLGRNRTFLIKKGKDIDILTDIKGVTYLNPNNYYKQIINRIKKLGLIEYDI